MSALSDPVLPIVSFSWPHGEWPRNCRRRLDTPRRAGQPASAHAHDMDLTTVKVESAAHDMSLPTVNVESAVGDVRDPLDMPRAKVESAVGDVRGAHDMDLPTVSVESAVGDECDPHAMPIVDVESAVGGVHRPWKRTRTADDLRRVAARFGEDLVRADLDALPRDWISLPSARRVLTEAGISCEKIDVLEVYAGSARWTRACEAAGLRTVAASRGSRGVDILGGWDLTMEGARRLLWAVVVVCAPAWVHSGFPCTFWSVLAHLTSKATIAEEEESRECALAHVILACQLARWQHKKGYHVSFENPPSARSWKLDIVKNTVAAIWRRHVQG